MTDTRSRNPIILALDVPTRSEAFHAIEQIGNAVGAYKIGLQLFTACGPEVVRAVKETGAAVFLDLKFHDIPNTVRHAVESATALGVDLLTIHLCGGGEMIRAALAGNRTPDQTTLLGVTVLTSSNEATLAETGVVALSVADQVLQLANLGYAAGIRGFVCSPQEIGLLRETLGPEVLLVTPGVRPAWSAAGDQKRIMTPNEAIAAGANRLVIGRPILADAEPKKAALRILEEIAA